MENKNCLLSNKVMATDMPCMANKTQCLSDKHWQHRRRSVIITVIDTFKVCCAKGFRFGSHLGDFRGSSGWLHISIHPFHPMGPLLLYFSKLFRFRGWGYK